MSDYIDIARKKGDYKSLFRQRNVEAEQECVKVHEPYCYRCAKMDFEDDIEQRFKDLMRDKKVSDDDLKLDVNSVNMKVYSDKKRFTKIAETDAIDSVLIIGGHRKSQKIGINKIYQCNKCGAKITVFNPLDETKKSNKPDNN